MLTKQAHKIRRAIRVRSQIQGSATRPRLSVFRSNSHIFVQAIDDVNGVTLASASDLKIQKGTKTERAQEIGKEIASKLLANGVQTCVFDRGGNLYHGRVKALADGAREAGLSF